MSLAALSVFSIWKAPSVHAVVLSISCVFSAVTVTVFGTLDFIEMNVYDTSLRLHGVLLSLVPRPSTPPVFDRLQYIFDCLQYLQDVYCKRSKTGGVEGLGTPY